MRMVAGGAMESEVRCVVVGDDAVGKTSMLMGYATNRYPTQHVPSVFDNYAGRIKVGRKTLQLQIIDTLEVDESPSIRLSEYPGTDIFVVCFSVVRPETLRHVEDVWLPEIGAHAPPRTPFILVGTQADLRDVDEICNMLRERQEEPVTAAQGSSAARRLGAACYIECSPGVEKKLKKIINSAIASVLKVRDVEVPAARGRHRTAMCTIL
ncbi:cdc42 homolog [Babylonia areolata]|uniref:cdc42 homolog n=1 Tax=Babylonia areolata TaxID=304850 RepID=UPI003FD4BC8B